MISDKRRLSEINVFPVLVRTLWLQVGKVPQTGLDVDLPRVCLFHFGIEALNA